MPRAIPASVPPRLPRNPHLQILRALAAALVIVDHGFDGLKNFGQGWPQLSKPQHTLGGVGVAAFFILSGFLMYRQSITHFASTRNAAVFAFRRFVRVVPMYWIALTFYAAVLVFHWHVHMPHLRSQYALSMAMLPNPYAPPNMLPLVPHGWTLNMEVFFYALFSLSLLLSRKRGVATLFIILGGLYIAGMLIPGLPSGVGQTFAWFYTRQYLLLFLVGITFAIFETHIAASTHHRFPFSPALLLLAPAIAIMAFPFSFGSSDVSDGFLLIAAVVVFLCILGKGEPSNGLERLLVLLGDASYSTYLFHSWPTIFVFPLVHHFFAHRIPLLVAFSAVNLVACNILGVAIHFVLERPLTRWLQSLAFRKNARMHAAVERPNLGV